MTTSTDTRERPAVSVDELKRAWHAVRAGDFRRRPPRPRTTPDAANPSADWTPAPGERVVPIVGAAGSVGASTVALTLSLASPGPTRIVECCAATASGLAAATTAELGLHETGWRQGKRDHVLIERTSQLLVGIDEVPEPTPSEHDTQLTVLDVGWDAGCLATSSGWLATMVTTAPVVVTVATATVPGFRRLEAALKLLGVQTGADIHRIALAIVGPRRKKWPRGLEHAGGALVRHALAADRCVEIPRHRDLEVTGLDSRPVPPPLISAARQLLEHIDLPTDTSESS